MEIEIKSLGLNNGLEIGMDQYKNIYSKPKDNDKIYLHHQTAGHHHQSSTLKTFMKF